MTDNLTVRAEPVAGYHALVMLWEHDIRTEEVQPAFDTITAHLNATDTPMYVLVDLLQDPQFPLLETISGALWGPFRNPMLKEWLVIGSNNLARVIARMLMNATRRKNIRWFKSYDEARTYMQKTQADSAAPTRRLVNQ
jgi:hypothetical protein